MSHALVVLAVFSHLSLGYEPQELEDGRQICLVFCFVVYGWRQAAGTEGQSPRTVKNPFERGSYICD